MNANTLRFEGIEQTPDGPPHIVDFYQYVTGGLSSTSDPRISSGASKVSRAFSTDIRTNKGPGPDQSRISSCARGICRPNSSNPRKLAPAARTALLRVVLLLVPPERERLWKRSDAQLSASPGSASSRHRAASHVQRGGYPFFCRIRDQSRLNEFQYRRLIFRSSAFPPAQATAIHLWCIDRTRYRLRSLHPGNPARFSSDTAGSARTPASFPALLSSPERDPGIGSHSAYRASEPSRWPAASPP